VEETTLSKIIRFNTGFDNCPENVFFSSQNCIGAENYQCIPRLTSSSNSNSMDFQHEYDEMKREKERMEQQTTILIVVAAVLGGVVLCLFLIAVIMMCKGGRSKSKEFVGEADSKFLSKFFPKSVCNDNWRRSFI